MPHFLVFQLRILYEARMGTPNICNVGLDEFSNGNATQCCIPSWSFRGPDRNRAEKTLFPASPYLAPTRKRNLVKVLSTKTATGNLHMSVYWQRDIAILDRNNFSTLQRNGSDFA
jgi:hypothetical protein